MADTCIVCLGDLRSTAGEVPPPELAAPTAEDGSKKSVQVDDETIAHLLPCKHDLHNACLTPWVERANSCPICRAIFNEVQLSEAVGGPVFDSYAVQNKVQEADVDPSMIVEDELFAVEAWEPCLVCGALNDGHGAMWCDGCNRSVHVFCAGFDDSPDVWYCETCLVDLERDTDLPGMASALRRQPRRRAPGPQSRRRRTNDTTWARVWQEVSRRIDLDLDFPFDEEITDQRTEEQRREFQRWQRRFEVASRHSAGNRLRDIARLNPAPLPQPAPGSQEELRAWNAFDKARESQDAPIAVRRRKRPAVDAPGSPRDDAQAERPILKRPRLRRPPGQADQPESSTTAARRNGDEPTFLSSLLREVENKPVSAISPSASEQVAGPFSPQNSSPMRSPASSEPGTPRAGTPPPQRPSSPPLSSTILPLPSPTSVTFSPFSAVGGLAHDSEAYSEIYDRGRRQHARGRRSSGGDEGLVHEGNPDWAAGPETSPHGRASSTSPSRTLSYSAKQEVQRMVKLALGSRYRDKEITKNEYTDINKDVSRKLYGLVIDASALADQREREKWQAVADDEVAKAIASLSVAKASGSESDV